MKSKSPPPNKRPSQERAPKLPGKCPATLWLPLPSSLVCVTFLLVGMAASIGHGPHDSHTNPAPLPPADATSQSASASACRFLRATWSPLSGTWQQPWWHCHNGPVAWHLALTHVLWPITRFLALAVIDWTGASTGHNYSYHYSSSLDEAPDVPSSPASITLLLPAGHPSTL